MRIPVILVCSVLISLQASAQLPRKDSVFRKTDTIPFIQADTSLRIINLAPFFTIHVDSVLQYDMQINKPLQGYYWYLRNSPVGVRIDRTTGMLYFKADKSFFKSGKLRYDEPYRVDLGVQNLYNPQERVDTGFTILFYKAHD